MDQKSNASTRLIYIFLALLVFGLIAAAGAYPVQVNIVSNKNGFTTTTIKCQDIYCAGYTSSGRQDSITSTNTNGYSITGSGTIPYMELDYASCQVPHMYRLQMTGTTTNGPYTVQRNFSQLSSCTSKINSVQVSNTNPNEKSPITITANVQSVMGFPKDNQGRIFDFSMVPIPSDLNDYYSTATQVTLKVKDANGAVVSTTSKPAKPLINKSDTVSFDYIPQLDGSYTIEIETQLADCKCTSTQTTISSPISLTVKDTGPTANFIFGSSIEDQLTQFTDQSSSLDGIVSRTWDFGDQTSVVNDILTPTHNYTKPGSYQVSLTVREGDGNPNTATQTIIVSPVNDMPQIIGNPPSTKTLNEDFGTYTDSTFDLTQYESDEEDGPAADGNNLKWTVSGFDSSLVSASVDQATDVLTLTSLQDKFGSTTLTLTLTDSGGLTATKNLQVTINQQPETQGSTLSSSTTLSSDSVFTSSTSQGIVNIQSSTITGSTIIDSSITNSNVQDSFIDPSTVTGSTIVQSRIVNSVVTNSNITRSNITDMQVSNAVVTDNVLQSGTIVFGGQTYTGQISLAEIQNKQPVATQTITQINWNEDSTDSTLNLNTQFSDPEGQALTFTNTNVQNINISVSNGVVTFTSDSNFNTVNNPRSVTFTATDTFGKSASISVTLNVAAQNDVPTITTTAPIPATQGQLYSYDVDASDIDGDTLVFSLQNPVSGITINSVTGLVQWTPTNSQVGNNQVTVQVTDGTNSTQQSFTVSVANVNDAPILSAISTQNTTEDVSYSFNVNADDPDLAYGDTLTYSISDSRFTITKISNTLANVSFLPTNSDVGSFSVTVTAKDAQNSQDTKTFRVNVANTNDAPALADISNQNVAEDSAFQFNLTASDDDLIHGDVLTYSVNDSRFTVNKISNTLAKVSFLPTNPDVGTISVKATVIDSSGSTSSKTFTVIVSNTNDAPTITVLEPNGGELLNGITKIKWTASDVDVGDTLLVNIFTTVDGQVFQVLAQNETNDGEFDWDTDQSSDSTNHRVRVEVTDRTTTVSDDSNSVFSVDNTPPTVDILGTFNLIESTNSVQFNSTATDSISGVNSSTFSWTFSDGSSLTGSSASKTFSQQTTLNVTLNVKDNLGNEGSVTKTITVDDTKPVPGFTLNPSSGISEGATLVAFNSTSTAYDQPLTFLWDFGDGSTSIQTNPTHVFVSNGTYTVNLTVTDFDSSTNSTTQTVTVNDLGPNSNFTYSPSTISENTTTVQFTDASTSSPDTITSRFWDFGDGSNSTQTNPTHVFVNNNTYTVSLTVVDSDGTPNTFSQPVLVLDNSPAVEAGPNQTVNEGSLVSFDGSGSTSNPDSITLYFWDFGDGTNSTGVAPTHTYTSNNIYTVVLTVTDVDGSQKSDTLTITVNDKSPNTDFSFVPSNPDEDQTISFTDNSTSPADSISSYFWDFGDGSTDNTQNSTHFYTFGGTFGVIHTTTDSDGSINSTIKNVTVNPVNDAPVFNTSTPLVNVTFNEDTNGTLSLAPSFFDIDNSDLNWTYTSDDISNISVLIDQNTGIVTFIPDSDFNGIRQINFTATDSLLNSNESNTITLTVNPVNDAPVVSGFADVNFPEDQNSTTFDLNSFVLDVDNSDDQITWSASGQNQISANIDNVAKTLNFTSALNFNGAETITLTATDPSGANNSQTIQVNVTAVNDQPTINSAALTSATEDILYTYTVNASDVDFDVLDFSLLESPTGMTINSSTGLVEWTPNNNQVGLNNVSVQVSDGNGGLVQQNFTINVTNVNDLPALASIQTQNTTEDILYQFNVTASDDDLIHGDGLTYSVNDTRLNISKLSETLASLSFLPTNDDVGTFSVKVTVTDSQSQTDSKTFTVNVANVNDAPEFNSSNPIQNLTFAEDNTATLDLTGHFFDIDANSILTYEASPIQNITININQTTGVATLVPDLDFNGLRNVTFKAIDGLENSTDSNTIIINVTPVNDFPVISAIPNVSMNEEGVTLINLSDYVTDVDNDKSELTWGVVGGGTGSSSSNSFCTFGVNSTVNNTDKTLSITGSPNACGNGSIGIGVSDPCTEQGCGFPQVSRTINIELLPINDAPVVSGIPNVNFAEDGISNTLNLSQNVSDVDDFVSNLIWSAFGQTNVIVNIDNTAKTVNFSAASNFFGSELINLTATDPSGANNSQTINVTVTSVNDNPQIDSLVFENPTGSFGQFVSGNLDLKANASDPVDPTGSISKVEFEFSTDSTNGANGTWTSIINDTLAPFQKLSWPTEPQGGTDSIVWIRAKATDNEAGLSDYFAKNLSVDNQAPNTTSNYDNQWKTSDITINLTGNDFAGAGVSQTEYEVNGNGLTKTVDVDGQPVISTEGANNYLTFFSTDNLGQVEILKNLTGVKLDKTDPVIQNLVVSQSNLTEDSTGNYVVNVTVFDSVSGLASTPTITYKIGNQASVTANLNLVSGNDYTFTISEPVQTWDFFRGENLVFSINTTDIAGRTSSQSVSDLIDNINDLPSVSITTINGQSPAYGFFPASIDIFANAADGNDTIGNSAQAGSIQNLTFEYSLDSTTGSDGTFQFCSGSSSSNPPSFGQACNNILSSGQEDNSIWIRVRAQDNNGSLSSYSIQQIAIDNKAPVTVDNITQQWFTTPITVNLSATDSGSGVNITKWCRDTTNTCTPNKDFATNQISVSADGVSYLRYRSTDNVGNLESTKNTTIRIDTILPQIQFDTATPANNSVIKGSELIQVSASDTNLKNITVYLDGTIITGGTCTSSPCSVPFDTTTVTDGTHYVNSTVFDQGGNTNKTETRTITVDNSKPQIVFNTPISGNYNSTQTINITASDSNPTSPFIKLFVDGIQVNSTSTVQLIHILTDGNHTVYATATDVVGQSSQTQTRQILVDTINPLIDFDVSTPSNNSALSGIQTVNITASDTNLQEITIFIDSSNVTCQSSCVLYWNTSNDGGGTHQVYATVTDIVNNSNSTETRTFVADNTNPTIDFVSPTPTNGNYSTSQIINVTASDAHLDTVRIEVDGVTVNSSSTSPVSFVLTEGSHTIQGFVNDTLGHTNQTEVRNVLVDTTNPEIQFVNSTPANNTMVAGLQIINVTASDTNLKNITIFVDGLSEQACTSSPCAFIWNTSDFLDADYNVNATVFDIVGNQNSTETRTISVDNTAPTITLVSPGNNSLSNNQTQNFQFNAVDDFATVSCDLYISNNGNPYVLSGSNSSVASGQNTTITNTSLGEGVNYWFVRCIDGVGNWNDSEVKTLNTDYTAPQVDSFVISGTNGNILSPANADGFYDIATLTINTSEDVTWATNSTHIINSTGNIIKRFNGPGTTSTSLVRNWDGLKTGFPVEFAEDGLYTINTTITDLAGNTNTVTVGTIRIDNTGPQFSLIGNSLFEGQVGSFNGTDALNSDAIAGVNSSSFVWDFGDGQTATGIIVNHTYAANGTYTARLNVTDNVFNLGTNTSTVSVLDIGPTANFSLTPSTISENTTTVQFTDASTSSPDTITSRFWDFGDGSNSTQTNSTHVFVNNNTYTVSLTVVDSDGSTNTLLQNLTVLDNSPSVVLSGNSTINEGQTGFFTATTSSNPDPITKYEWDFNYNGTFDVDQDTGLANTANSTFTSNGTFTVAVRVTDSDGSQTTNTTTITVNDLAPTAAITGTTSTFVGDTASYGASGSASNPDTIVKYEWDFNYTSIPSEFNVQNDTGTTASVDHVFSSSGIFTVAVRVTDSDGSTSISTISSLVQPQQTHDIAINSVTYNKASSTVYVNDQVTVSANISNIGNFNESISVRLYNGGTIDTVNTTINKGETKTVNLTWIPTSATAGLGLNVEVPQVTGETQIANNLMSVEGSPIAVRSVVENVNLTFVSASSFPKPSSSGNETSDPFFVWVKVDNLNGFDLKDLVLTIGNESLSVNTNQDSSTSTTKTYNPLSAGESRTFWWKLNAVTGTHNLTARIGNVGDRVEVSRVVAIS